MMTPAVSVWAPAVCRTGALLAALALLAAAPARASGGRDDCAPCTRHARGEYQAEHERSRHLGHLDCAGLTAYNEHHRQCYNQHILAIYLRPIGTTVRPAPPSSPASRTGSALEPIPAPAPAPGPTSTPPAR